MPAPLKPIADRTRRSQQLRRQAPSRVMRTSQASSLIKLGMTALAALLVLGLGGWWFYKSLGGRNKSEGLNSHAVPDGLERLLKTRDVDLEQARLMLNQSALSYLKSWEDLQAVESTYNIQDDVYAAELAHAAHLAQGPGGLSSPPTPTRPEYPVQALHTAQVQINAAKREYETARERYNNEARKIQLQFEKQVSSFMTGVDPKEFVPTPVKPHLEEQIAHADALLGQHGGRLLEELWGFGSL